MSEQYVFVGEHPTFKTDGEYKHLSDTVQVQVLVSQDKDGNPIDMPYYTNMMYSNPSEFAEDWMPLDEWRELHPDEDPIPVDTADDPDPVEEAEKEKVGYSHEPEIHESDDFVIVEPDNLDEANSGAENSVVTAIPVEVIMEEEEASDDETETA